MGTIRRAVRGGLQTVFRMAPWPTETGLRAVGSPGPESPVLITGNYDLTVRRLLRALDGVDAWVVVAPSRGINVWCAASGGHLGSHQVITALKTSGVEDVVRHRRAVLPQLAATGVRARDVVRRCGWNVRFGPVRVEDISRYLADRQDKTDDMRHVRFGVWERLEMAAAWGGPGALLAAAIAVPVAPSWALPLALLVASLAVVVFCVYDRLPEPRRPVLCASAGVAAVGVTALAGGGFSALATAAVVAVLSSVALTFDYAGSTPIEGGSHFEERSWQVVLDPERCEGVYKCWEVCPEACFAKPDAASGDRTVRVPHAERCIRCGACVVQCPLDALAFQSDRGDRIDPDVIRRFKLNLLGRRTVEAGPTRPV